MIAVRPDPSNPIGGYARLELPAEPLGADEIGVEIFDNYSGRYLGRDGWQPVRVAFGPYRVVRQGAMAVITIGPEIVNRMEEYQPVRISVGPVQADVSWPDDVIPAPGAAVIGDIWTAPHPSKAKPDNLVGQIPKAPPVTTPVPEPAPPPEAKAQVAAPEPVPAPAPQDDLAGIADDAPDQAPANRKPLIFGGIALLVLAAAAAAFLLTRSAPDSEPVAAVPPPAAQASGACASADLQGLVGQGFGAVRERLSQCGAQASADDALAALESAARAGDPAALTLFGEVYDGQATDPLIETTIGLTFPESAASAADYYARAAAAGSTEAAGLLRSLCQRMMTLSDTLSKGAYEDYCAH